jgi:hypothetical protein
MFILCSEQKVLQHTTTTFGPLSAGLPRNKIQEDYNQLNGNHCLGFVPIDVHMYMLVKLGHWKKAKF